MTYNSYAFLLPLPEPLHSRFYAWVGRHPFAGGRLVAALEEFAASEAAVATRAAASRAGDREIFLVPPRHVLGAVPDAACLVRADHGTATLEIVDFVQDYGGAGEAHQWTGLVEHAASFL